MRDTSMDPPTSDFMGVNFPSLEYSLDMLSEFQPQHPSDFFVPTSIAPLDFESGLFPLPSATVSVQLQHSTELPDSANAKQPLSSSSSGSPGKERKGSRRGSPADAGQLGIKVRFRKRESWR
ncbi:TPA: hypothetical protein ACH3X2_006998 [Trebouxia sp. C0005]